jgi:outer membrane protein assembly factor BamB
MTDFAVVPVLIGPMQVLLTILPGLILAMLSALVSLLHPRAVWNTLKILWRQKIQVAVVLVVAGGLVWAGSAAWRLLTPPEATTQAVAGSDWPMARGSLLRRGVVPGERGPTRPGVIWKRQSSSKERFYSTPTVVGNRVYIASAEMFGIASSSGKLYCFDADTGAKVWELAPDGYCPTFSSPVVAGHYLVCGEGLHNDKKGRVVCVDLRNERQPKILWTHRASDHVECTPIIAGDRVYVGAGDDGVYCLALEPGPDGKAKVIWHVHGDNYLDAETALAVHDGKVYVGLGLEGFALVVLDAKDGKELQRLTFDRPIFSPPSIADGKLYFAMGYGDYVLDWRRAGDAFIEELKATGKSQEVIDRFAARIVREGIVCCVDLATFKVDWTFKTKETVLGAVVVAGEQLYCCGRDGHVYCLSRGGKLLDSWYKHTPIVTSPAVTHEHVYVVDTSGMLYALDRKKLEEIWRQRLGPPGDRDYVSSPTVARGHVYVGTPSEGLLCVGEPGDEHTPPSWPSALGGAARGGNADESAIGREADLQWQFLAVLRAPVAVLGDYLLVPVAEGTGAGLTCFPASAMAPKAPEPLWTMPLPHGVHGSPVGFGDSVWCVDGKPGDQGRHLHALALRSGKLLWKTPVAPEAWGVLVATESEVFVQDQPDQLTCFNHQGQKQWSQKVGRLRHAPAVTKTMIVAASVEPGILLVLDRPTGRILWKQGLEAPPTASPLVRKDRIYLGTAAALEARSLLDGTAVPGWQRTGGGVSADFCFHRELLIYTNHAGELVVLHATSGAVQVRLGGAIAGRPPLVSRDVVLFAAKLVLSGAELPQEVATLSGVVAGSAAAAAILDYPGREGLKRVVLHRNAADIFVMVAGVAGGPQVLARPWAVVPEEAEEWFDTTDQGTLTTPLVLFNGQVYGGTAKGLVRLGKE